MIIDAVIKLMNPKAMDISAVVYDRYILRTLHNTTLSTKDKIKLIAPGRIISSKTCLLIDLGWQPNRDNLE